MSQHEPSTVPELVARRIQELAPARSPAQIAAAAGLSRKIFTSIRDGRMKLPLDYVEQLADALQMDVRELMRAALAQFFPPEILELVLSVSQVEVGNSPVQEEVLATAVSLRVEVIGIDGELTQLRKRLAGAAHALELLAARQERVTRALEDLLHLVRPQPQAV